MTILRSGTTEKYAANWNAAFGDSRKKSTAKKKSTGKKKAAKAKSKKKANKK